MASQAALSTALKGVPGLALSEFSTWPLLFQFPAFTPRGERYVGLIETLKRSAFGV